MTFSLDPQLATDTHFVTDLPLCQVLLHSDANYPWCILVPRQANVVELSDLDERNYQQLWHESRWLCSALTEVFEPHKLNVATLGNMVPQLHVHHIVRYPNDAAWPKPIWGAVPALGYDEQTLDTRIQQLQQQLQKEQETP